MVGCAGPEVAACARDWRLGVRDHEKIVPHNERIFGWLSSISSTGQAAHQALVCVRASDPDPRGRVPKSPGDSDGAAPAGRLGAPRKKQCADSEGLQKCSQFRNEFEFGRLPTRFIRAHRRTLKATAEKPCNPSRSIRPPKRPRSAHAPRLRLFRSRAPAGRPDPRAAWPAAGSNGDLVWPHQRPACLAGCAGSRRGSESESRRDPTMLAMAGPGQAGMRVCGRARLAASGRKGESAGFAARPSVSMRASVRPASERPSESLASTTTRGPRPKPISPLAPRCRHQTRGATPAQSQRRGRRGPALSLFGLGRRAGSIPGCSPFPHALGTARAQKENPKIVGKTPS